LACRDLKWEIGLYLIDAGANVDKLSNTFHPALLTGKSLAALKRIKNVDAKTQENIISLVVSIVSQSTYDHRSKSIFKFFSKQEMGRIFNTFD
jgi:hypothetical protein